jgi:hypothetical protein
MRLRSSVRDYDVTFVRRHTLAELAELLLSFGLQLVVDAKSQRVHATT